MTASAEDLYELLRTIRYDLTAAQGKLTSAFSLLGELNIVDRQPTRCPSCGVELAGPRTLAEHLHNSHEGPVPEHWLAVEAVSVEPTIEEAA